MITNLIDKPKWFLYLSKLTKQVLQIGFIVDCTNWLHMRTGLRNKVKTLTLITDIDWEPDKISYPVVSSGWFQEQSTTKELGWSAEYHKLGRQPLHVDSKPPRSISRIFVFSLYVFIDSCLNFAKQEWLKSHALKEKVFLEIA